MDRSGSRQGFALQAQRDCPAPHPHAPRGWQRTGHMPGNSPPSVAFCNNSNAAPSYLSDRREDAMAIRFEDVNEDLRRIVLSGRLDTAGSEEIAQQFAELTQSSKGGVVYLSEVRCLSSMAISMLVKGAKAAQAMGGRLALYVAENEVIIRT